MKKTWCLLAFAAVFHGSATAQNVLELCKDELSDPYHGRVNQVIDAAIAQPARLQLTTFPSFEPESGLRLAASGIYFVELQSSFWADSYICNRKGACRMDFKKPRVRTKASYAPLSEPVVDRIERVYAKAIAQAKDARNIGIDGVMYIFSAANGACGWAWSPQPQSPNGRLVEMVRLLEKHARFSAAADLLRSENALLELLETIERR